MYPMNPPDPKNKIMPKRVGVKDVSPNTPNISKVKTMPIDVKKLIIDLTRAALFGIAFKAET